MDGVSLYPIGHDWYLEYINDRYSRHIYIPPEPPKPPEWPPIPFGD